MATTYILEARLHDLGGGFVVRRLLPSAARAAVGPFVFFDHFGPVQARPGDNHDVRPHPHIGLSTVTFLFEGAMQHRDSTGAVQRMVDNLTRHCGEAPECIMTGGAGWKMAPSMSVNVELVESLIFEGLLEIASRRFKA